MNNLFDFDDELEIETKLKSINKNLNYEDIDEEDYEDVDEDDIFDEEFFSFIKNNVNRMQKLRMKKSLGFLGKPVQKIRIHTKEKVNS